jgi:uncharacterized protein (DUF924 family)
MAIRNLLDFWFLEPQSPGYLKPRPVWFKVDPAFDAEIRDRFAELCDLAASGGLNDWAEEPDGAVALLLLLDQVPRNLFRGTPDAYRTDAMARSVARSTCVKQFDRDQPPVRRWFVYMPFMHSEDLVDQAHSIRLFDQLRDDADSQASIDAAHRHHEIIARFGRFPHRNAILGRVSTPMEQAFLTEPNSAF